MSFLKGCSELELAGINKSNCSEATDLVAKFNKKKKKKKTDKKTKPSTGIIFWQTWVRYLDPP